LAVPTRPGRSPASPAATLSGTIRL
jgi:hypothetical protein